MRAAVVRTIGRSLISALRLPNVASKTLCSQDVNTSYLRIETRRLVCSWQLPAVRTSVRHISSQVSQRDAPPSAEPRARVLHRVD